MPTLHRRRRLDHSGHDRSLRSPLGLGGLRLAQLCLLLLGAAVRYGPASTAPAPATAAVAAELGRRGARAAAGFAPRPTAASVPRPRRSGSAGRTWARDSRQPELSVEHGVSTAASPTSAPDVRNSLRVTALGGDSRASFILEMGGQKLLVNPNLEGNTEYLAEQVHQQFDYVILTSAKAEFFHAPTIRRMNLAKTNFVASEAAGQKLSRLMAQNIAILMPGPGARTALVGEKDTTPIAVLVAPGAPKTLPWESMESAFIFVNLQTGLALGYEATGLYLGPGASSNLEGIPEEAYQIDHLVTPDLRETAEVLKGLNKKGAVIKSVTRLPTQGEEDTAGAPNPLMSLLGPVLAVDRGVDQVLGGVGDVPEEFLDFLKRSGAPLEKTKLLLPKVGGGTVDLE